MKSWPPRRVISPAEHPVFREFFSNGKPVLGFRVNFVGQKINPKFTGASSDAFTADYPRVSDESFEWIATLEAVLSAQETFTMFELGAGFGRWLVTAVCAARQKHSGIKFRLVAVEAEPTHFQYLKQHFLDNGLDPCEHWLVQAAVNDTGTPAHFIIGHPDEWYGQAMVPQGYGQESYPQAAVVLVEGIRLADLLAPYEFVDLIDMDIQGAEADVILSSINELTKKVRRLYVATHSLDIHEAIQQQLVRAGGGGGDYWKHMVGPQVLRKLNSDPLSLTTGCNTG